MGMLIAFDPGPMLGQSRPREEFKALMREVDLALRNAHEICHLTRESNLRRSPARMRDICPGNVVVKCGAAGVRRLEPGESNARHIAAPRVRAVNAVGAGDTFNGALSASLLRGTNLPRAIEEAIRAVARLVASGAGVLGVPSSANRAV
ncbi:MAG: bifunctional hydroxymethylpyrimidine kinase/phosphomethylpyrimidine kinase [Undibacterium sp.]|nr:bifunctional hydroxymethylpyrimidine kinase/phosphomethylpyrimidine kinase [Opitutaceae bacterium]